MVIEAGMVAGYVIAWAARKVKRVGGRLDAEVDAVLDASLDRLQEVVEVKLGSDPVLAEVIEEVSADGEVTELTRQRLELSLQAAALKDAAFAEAVTNRAAQVKLAERAAGPVAEGQGSIAVAGNVRIHADGGSAAAVQMGDVRIGSARQSDPTGPDQVIG